MTVGLVAPSSHRAALPLAVLMQVAALAKVFDSVAGRSPHRSGPETPDAETWMTPFPGFTLTLHFKAAEPVDGPRRRATPRTKARARQSGISERI